MTSSGAAVTDYELAAFTQIRGLQGLRAGWGEIVAASQRVVAEAEESGSDEVAFLRSSEATELLAAARSLDTTSRPQSSLRSSERRLLSIEAAVAYAINGNFSASTALVDELLKQATSADETSVLVRYAAVLGATAPSCMGALLARVGDALPSADRDFLEGVARFVEGRPADDLNTAISAWEAVVRASLNDSHKSSLLRGVRPILHQIGALSIWTVLNPLKDRLPVGYLETLSRKGVTLLMPSQEHALRVEGFLTTSYNSLVSMPTGTGKTLLGQICMAASVGRANGLVCYVAPYQALANQVYSTFRDQLPSSIRVERAVGGYSPTSELSPGAGQVAVVATPERFDAMLRHNPELFGHMRCVVFDEAHTLEQADRGVRLEGMLGRLRLHQLRTGSPRLVLLSAVIAEATRIQRWLDIPDRLVVRTDWLPTTRRVAIWKQPGTLQYLYADDRLRPPGVSGGAIMGSRVLPWPFPNIRPPLNYGHRVSQTPDSNRNVAYLCRALLEEFGGPILCVCATKVATRAIAYSIADTLPDSEPGQRTRRLIAEIQQKWPHLRLLRTCLARRVAYHNASLPGEVRELIQEAADNWEIKVVAATTTLAEGVNLPFRFTVLADWLMWAGDRQIPMSSPLFRNIAGRCGRPRWYTEGDTIIYDNPLGDLEFTNPETRTQRIVDELVAPAGLTVRSPIEGLIPGTGLSDSDRQKRIASLASQYLAAIRENVGEQDVAGAFLGALLAGTFRTVGQIRHVLQGIEEDLLGKGQLAMVARASPLTLTPFGQSCFLTGLSPLACRTIVERLAVIVDERDTSAPKLLASFLQALIGIPELLGTPAAKACQMRSRFPIKPADFEEVISWWLVGNALELGFSRLPYVRRSGRSPSVDRWLEGMPQPTTWDAVFDDYCDFIEQVLQRLLPWACRGVELLKEHCEVQWIRDIPWASYGGFLELGVDTKWAVLALAQGCPVGRTIAAPFGRAVERVSGDIQQTVIPPGVWGKQFDIWLGKVLTEMERDSLVARTPSDHDLHKLTEWLEERRPLSING